MSITDLKALGESWAIGARKLPAAPALWLRQCLKHLVFKLPTLYVVA